MPDQMSVISVLRKLESNGGMNPDYDTFAEIERLDNGASTAEPKPEFEGLVEFDGTSHPHAYAFVLTDQGRQLLEQYRDEDPR